MGISPGVAATLAAAKAGISNKRRRREQTMRRRHANGALSALGTAGVLTVLLLGNVLAAHATVTDAQGTPVSRAQAVRHAKQYLQFQPFSFKGLVSQLKYEGYSTSDATYGASHSGANWMKQAARHAKQYLKIQPFSRSGLVEQLKYEGYTSAQALYGVRAAGL
jgi:hypothetical protein